MIETTRGEIAFDLHQRIVANEKERRQLMAKNAELLNEMYEGNYYQDFLGDNEGQWAGSRIKFNAN